MSRRVGEKLNRKWAQSAEETWIALRKLRSIQATPATLAEKTTL